MKNRTIQLPIFKSHRCTLRGLWLSCSTTYLFCMYYGSEYNNYQVAKLLEKLRVEFTKSRPRHYNDNALAESKNAAVVRKHLGYAHIPQYCASFVNVFCAVILNPYV